MSEAFPGLSIEPLAVARPRDAAAVMLSREGPQGQEVFWVRRGKHLSFSAGFYAFPGGGVDAGDARVPVLGASDSEAALRAAAARELFEETGVLIARSARPFVPEELAKLRRALLDKSIRFAEVLERLGAQLHAADWTFAGRWITPAFSRFRFDARFFLAELPAGQRAEVWDGELSWGGWTTPQRALAEWQAGRALLHPPMLNAVQAFAAFGREGALPQLLSPPGVIDSIAERVEFQQGVFVYPLETPTLPPARHTTCYLLGNRELLVVDPGSPDPAEQDRLRRFVARLIAEEGRRVRAVVLTHHHRDHVGGAHAAARAWGAPVWAHAHTASRVKGVTRLLQDQEVIELAGESPMRLTVLHTPGHASGHICLLEEKSRALVCGDMISGLSTVVIDPPDGDMAQYLSSLRRLLALQPSTLYPAHGEAIPDGAAKLEETLEHRAWREERLLRALGAQPASLASITAAAYDDAPAAIRPVAERSALAGLLKLVAEGKAAREGDQFRRVRDDEKA